MTIRIGHGGASPEGENSTYVLPERGVIVDPGPPGDRAWKNLQAGLDGADVALDAIEHVVVTHWHIDHAGLAPRLAEAADATIHMHESDASLLADYAVERQARVRRDARRLLAWGAPERVVESVRESDDPSPVPDGYPVVPHAAGDTVAGLELVHTPGHTQGHLALAAGAAADGDGGAGRDGDAALFVGDAVLPTYTPNVGGSDTRLADPLTAFLRSLSEIEARAAALLDGTASPGHGAAVAVGERIGFVRRHHRQRIREVISVLGEYERATPWTVATELFGELEGIHAKMGTGEAAAHLTFIQKRGVVEQLGASPDQYVRCWDADLAAALDLSVDD